MRRVLLGTMPALLLLATACSDEERETLEAHNRQLTRRTEQLEQRNAELEGQVARLEAEMRELSIELPLPGATDDDAALEEMTVLVAADGSLYLDGRPVDEDGIAARAGELGDRGRATIAADAESRHERVVAVIDILRSNGLERFAVAVGSADDAEAR